MIFASFVSDPLARASFFLPFLRSRTPGALWSRSSIPVPMLTVVRSIVPGSFLLLPSLYDLLTVSLYLRLTSAKIKVKMKHAYIKICPLLILAFFGSCLMARLGQYFFFGAGHELSTPQLLLLLLALFIARRYLCFAAGGSPFRVCLQNPKRSTLVLILPTPKAQISFFLLLPGCC